MSGRVLLRLGHFPQKCQRFRANGFLAIRYANAAAAKFCNILTVQNFYSDFLVVFRMLPRIRVCPVKDIVSVNAAHLILRRS